MAYTFPKHVISHNMKIVIYGAGIVGKSYYEQFITEGYSVVLWIDKDVKKQTENPEIKPVDKLKTTLYDCIIIAVLDENIAFDIRQELLGHGIELKRIIWKKPQITYDFLQHDNFLQDIFKWRLSQIHEDIESVNNMYCELNSVHTFCRMINKYGSIEPPIWYKNEQKKIAYLNNKKVACSSLQASLLNMPQFDNYISLHDKTSKEGVNNLVNANSFFKYTFVRNPFSRLISCYKNKYITDRKIYGNNPNDLYFGRRNYLFGWLKDVKTFEEFIKKVCVIPEEWQDGHFSLQYNLIYKDEKCLVDYIGHFETLSEEYSDIQQKYSLTPLMTYNKTGDANWEDYYTLELAEMVYKKYQKDIETFGYQKECQDFIAKLKADC